MKKRSSSLPAPVAVLAPVVLIVLAAYGALSWVKSLKKGGDTHTADVTIGSTVADYSFKDLDGVERKLSSFLVPQGGNRVVLINFWASWCEACIAEMPSINKLRATYKDQGFEVIGVNLDEKPAAVVPAAVKNLKMLFPIFADPEAEIADTLDVHAIPFTILVDRNRKLLHFQSGDRDWMDNSFRTQLEAWLQATR